MKKLIVLVVAMLVIGLLAGCWVLPESKLISIGVELDDIDLSPESTYQLEVTAYYEDETKDVTSDCEYCTYDCEVATVNNEGLNTAMDTGDTDILVSYTEQNFWTGKITETEIVGIHVVSED